MEQVLEKDQAQVVTEDDNWEMDVKMCRLDGHTMAEGELCEACQ